MERQLLESLVSVTDIQLEETRIKAFNKYSSTTSSFQVYDGEYAGIHYVQGSCDPEEGYAQAERNLEIRRPYKFPLETGVRHRDKTEQQLSDKELMDLAREVLEYLKTHHPEFIIAGDISTRRVTTAMKNSLGLDYSNTDCIVNFEIAYKHKDSKDITDGWFSLGLRTLDFEKFTEMADNYLGAYLQEAQLPEELILQDRPYGYLWKITESLEGENLALGTSLLTGRLGEQVFSEDLTVLHDVGDENTWFTPFFDGEGAVNPDDQRLYIDKGVVLTGYADKRTAEKYGIPHTGSAGHNMTDIPQNGYANLRIKPSDRTVKELLGGRLTVVPIVAAGGGYNEKGDYVTPVQKAMLCDGERLLGRLPEFSIRGNLFDMFGKDFIGLSSDKVLFNDRSLLMRMEYSR